MFWLERYNHKSQDILCVADMNELTLLYLDCIQSDNLENNSLIYMRFNRYLKRDFYIKQKPHLSVKFFSKYCSLNQDNCERIRFYVCFSMCLHERTSLISITSEANADRIGISMEMTLNPLMLKSSSRNCCLGQ